MSALTPTQHAKRWMPTRVDRIIELLEQRAGWVGSVELRRSLNGACDGGIVLDADRAADEGRIVRRVHQFEGHEPAKWFATYETAARVTWVAHECVVTGEFGAVLRAVREAGGWVCADQVAQAAGRPVLSVRSDLAELARFGFLDRTSTRRRGRTNPSWFYAPAGAEPFKGEPDQIVTTPRPTVAAMLAEVPAGIRCKVPGQPRGTFALLRDALARLDRGEILPEAELLALDGAAANGRTCLGGLDEIPIATPMTERRELLARWREARAAMGGRIAA